jgi:hypothetical protein
MDGEDAGEFGRRLGMLHQVRKNKDYTHCKLEFEWLFTSHFLDANWTTKSASVIASGSNGLLDAHTIRRWRRTWTSRRKRGDDWRPWNHEENHGAHNRALTKEEEELVMERVRAASQEHQHITVHLVIRFVAIVTGEKRGAPLDVSVATVYRLLDRNKFSRMRAHLKRRPVVDPDALCEWIINMCEVLAKVDPHHFLNCDETCVRLLPTGLTTWAPVGEDDVQIEHLSNEKACFTAMAWCTAKFENGPLMLIGKGTTRSCETSFGALGPAAFTTHSSQLGGVD